ncbi:uncharacterized protein LOC123530370 isoform X2 [Mercenaria mercenaria]|uniref:uncharacterized protein LOC123530370 isoform X2 n=1 Tax=Mercenaria mercenaria TaxID=6596 RepID=UPI00234E6A3F|nr:uncharacterized protein LOC123530370 isoform X2 [Mercenaria mercenaria]
MCFGCAFLGVAFAWISPVIYNIQIKELDVYNVTISECAITESMKKTVFPLLNNVSLALLFVGALTGIITIYIFIFIKMKRVTDALERRWWIRKEAYVGYTDSKKHTVPDGNTTVNASESNTPEISDSDFFEQGNRRRKTEIEMQIARGRTERWKTYITVTDNASDIKASKALNAEFGVEGERRQTKRINIGTRNTYSKKKENDKISKGKITTTGDAFKTPNITILDALEKKPNEACKSKKSTPMRRSIRFRTRRIKLSLFLYSLACIVSYLPLLLILLIVNADKALTDSERAAYNFFHRSYSLHCAVNPIICGIIDVRFRKFCKMKLLCRKHEIIYEL